MFKTSGPEKTTTTATIYSNIKTEVIFSAVKN